MFYYIENYHTNPYFNLALEQAVFDRLDRQHSYCMLWQNDNAVIIGKHQITEAEINRHLVDSRGICVVRRLSGGGAVYHDLGNINFTFITDAGTGNDISFAAFCKPVQQALLSFGVSAVISGRNDMTVNQCKISGNAQYSRENRVMHHGTLLYDTDLTMLSQALTGGAKVESPGIASVRSRVTNIRPYMHTDMPSDMFRSALRDFLFAALDMREYTLSADDMAAAETLRDRVYSQWDWNYGASPPYNVRKSRRIEGCGTVEVLLNVGKSGIIENAAFHGDFFGTDDPADLAALLAGHRLEREELAKMVPGTVSRYFHNMEAAELLELLLD